MCHFLMAKALIPWPLLTLSTPTDDATQTFPHFYTHLCKMVWIRRFHFMWVQYTNKSNISERWKINSYKICKLSDTFEDAAQDTVRAYVNNLEFAPTVAPGYGCKPHLRSVSEKSPLRFFSHALASVPPRWFADGLHPHHAGHAHLWQKNVTRHSDATRLRCTVSHAHTNCKTSS